MILNEERLAAALPAYELGAQLGRGAFGVVMAARHRELGREVAVKVLPVGQGPNAEARLLALLDHAHIVRVFDAVTVDDLHLIVMEALPGGTLTRRAAGMTPEAVCAVGLAVAAALECAHRSGVLHRDVKPENILFDATGVLKVTDFGIAKLVEGAAADASASAVVGTPRYMAPEQLLAGRLNAATDLYSLGTMLYELFTGRPPYGAGLSAPSLIAHHLNVPPPPPQGVPARITQVLMRALAKEPGARQPSARAFALELAHSAAAELGPGWLIRSGIPVRVDDDIRAAADGHVQQLHAAPQTPYPVAQPHQTTPGPQHATPQPQPQSSGAQPGGAQSGGAQSGGARRPSRTVLVAAAAALLLAGVGTVLGITLAGGGGTTPAAAVASARASSSGGPAGGGPVAPASPTPAPRVGSRNAPQPLGPPLSAHTDGLWTVRVSSDGTLMASAGEDRTVVLWDLTNPASPRDLGTRAITHPSRIEEVAIASDKRTLAVGGDQTLRLWDISDPNAPSPLGAPLTGYVGLVYSVAFSPDAKLLAMAGSGETLLLWDVSDRTRPTQLARFAGYTAAVTFSPDGKLAASGNADGAVLWDVSDPTTVHPVAELPGVAAAYVYGLAFSADSRVLAASGDAATVHLWDVATPTAPRRLGPPLTDHTSTVVALAFSPDGRTLATGGDDHTVLLWDLANPAAPSRLGAPLAAQLGICAVAFTPDGHTLVAASGDSHVRLWGIG